MAPQHGSGRARCYCSDTCRSAARRRRTAETERNRFESDPTPGHSGGMLTSTRRTVGDLATARALAHPLRWRLLGLLRAEGPATATQLAARVGQSAANCSWHLRVLAAHDLIHRTASASRRETPWRARDLTLLLPEDTTAMPAEDRDALFTIFHEHEIDLFRSWWRRRRPTEPKAWRDAVFSQLSLAWVTPDEMGRLSTAIGDAVVAQTDRRRSSRRHPRDARQVRIFAWGVPA